MSKRSIYDNPYKYANICNVPYEYAKIACLKQRHYEKEMRKHKPYCPKCGSKHIGYEEGSYEEGYSGFFYCDTCGEDFDDVPNSDYFEHFGMDFDAVLYFSVTKDIKGGWLEACGAETLEEWQRFAIEMITGKRN